MAEVFKIGVFPRNDAGFYVCPHDKQLLNVGQEDNEDNKLKLHCPKCNRKWQIRISWR